MMLGRVGDGALRNQSVGIGWILWIGKMGIFCGCVSSPGEYPSLLESDMFSYKCHLGHFDIAAMRPKRGVFRDPVWDCDDLAESAESDEHSTKYDWAVGIVMSKWALDDHFPYEITSKFARNKLKDEHEPVENMAILLSREQSHISSKKRNIIFFTQ